MPSPLPAWLMPAMPTAKPRMREAHHASKGTPAAKKQKVGADSDAHTDPARNQKPGGNTVAHMGLVTKQKLARNVAPVKKQKLSRDSDVHVSAPVQGLQDMSARDDSPGLRASHIKDDMVQTEHDLTWSSPTKAGESVGLVAEPSLSSWPQQLFSDVDRELLNKRGLAKKARKQMESGRPQKRVQVYKSIRASQRCGYCKTCLNRSMKKACLTRRAEMGVANNVVE